jgi:hypothetical protein
MTPALATILNGDDDEPDAFVGVVSPGICILRPGVRGAEDQAIADQPPGPARYSLRRKRIVVLVSMKNSPGPGWAKRPWMKIRPCESRVRINGMVSGTTGASV